MGEWISVSEGFSATVSVIGAITCIGLYLSPLRGVYNNYRLGVEKDELFPSYFMMYLNCVGWMIYSMLIKDKLIYFLNMVGFICGTFSSDSLFRYAAKQHLFLILKIVGAMYFGTLGAIAAYIPDPATAETTVGFITAAILEAAYIAPIINMVAAIRKRDPASVPLLPSIFYTINGFVWTLYGCFRGNPFIVVPNLTGGVIGVAQVVVYCVVSPKDQRLPFSISGLRSYKAFGENERRLSNVALDPTGKEGLVSMHSADSAHPALGHPVTNSVDEF
eukprot:Colp12_sorted_trinity150504_noHs@32293